MGELTELEVNDKVANILIIVIQSRQARSVRLQSYDLLILALEGQVGLAPLGPAARGLAALRARRS